MKLRCEAELDSVKEAAMLLERFCVEGEQPPGDIVNRLQAARPELRISEAEKEVLRGLGNLRDQLKQKIVLTPKQMALLKPNCRLQREGEACTAVLYPFYDASGQDGVALTQQVTSMTAGQHRRRFLGFLLEWDDPCGETPSEEITLETFVRVLTDEADLSAEDKWHIVSIFTDFTAAFEQVLQPVLDVQSLLKENAKAFAPYLDSWKEWIERELEAGTDGVLLPRLYQMLPGLAREACEVVLRPSLCMLIGISITMDGALTTPENCKNAELRVGLAVPTFVDLLVGQPQISETELLLAMKLLSEKSKFDILLNVMAEPAYAAQLAVQLRLSPATISHHLGALLNQGLVMVDVKDNRAYYAPNTARINALMDRLKELFPAQ